MTEQVQREPTAAERPKIRLDTDQLTPGDLKRARVILGGRNPFELLDDPIDRVVLLIWCTRSRQDRSFTWSQAEETPFSELETATDEVPPPEASSGSNGSTPAAANGAKPSRSRSSAASIT